MRERGSGRRSDDKMTGAGGLEGVVQFQMRSQEEALRVACGARILFPGDILSSYHGKGEPRAAQHLRLLKNLCRKKNLCSRTYAGSALMMIK